MQARAWGGRESASLVVNASGIKPVYGGSSYEMVVCGHHALLSAGPQLQARRRRLPFGRLRALAEPVFGIQAWIVKPYLIPGGSMEPTLTVGQGVLVNRIGMDFSDPISGEIGRAVVGVRLVGRWWFGVLGRALEWE